MKKEQYFIEASLSSVYSIIIAILDVFMGISTYIITLSAVIAALFSLYKFYRTWLYEKMVWKEYKRYTLLYPDLSYEDFVELRKDKIRSKHKKI